MKSRLHRLEIRNFKAFREPFVLDVEGRHLLVYGSNGSGKSSLYWALYTFLQSANKPTPSVVKYFEPVDPQNLLNIHEQADPNPKLSEIALTVRDVTTKKETRYPISKADHSGTSDSKGRPCQRLHHLPVLLRVFRLSTFEGIQCLAPTRERDSPILRLDRRRKANPFADVARN